MARIVPSNKGGFILETEDHYRFCKHSHNKEKTVIYWRCELRKTCLATCKTNFNVSDEVRILGHGKHRHSHENRRTEIIVEEVVRGIKRKAREHPNEPPLSIVRTELAQVEDEEILMNLPQRRTLFRNVNRLQNERRPQNPRTLDELIIRCLFAHFLSFPFHYLLLF